MGNKQPTKAICESEIPITGDCRICPKYLWTHHMITKCKCGMEGCLGTKKYCNFCKQRPTHLYKHYRVECEVSYYYKYREESMCCLCYDKIVFIEKELGHIKVLLNKLLVDPSSIVVDYWNHDFEFYGNTYGFVIDRPIPHMYVDCEKSYYSMCRRKICVVHSMTYYKANDKHHCGQCGDDDPDYYGGE
jgi:hypothetical protein